MSTPAVLFHGKFRRQAATTGPQFQDFISRVFDNSANALELSHNDCRLPLIHDGIRTGETRTITRCDAVCYHGYIRDNKVGAQKT